MDRAVSDLKPLGISVKTSLNDRLILGTAAFGMDYGATNSRGIVPADEMKAILQKCRDLGITGLDTAQAYGQAEENIGQAGLGGFSVTTKITLLPQESADLIPKKIEYSLAHLQLNKVKNLLLHNDERIATGSDAASVTLALRAAKERGQATRVGVSSYEPSMAFQLCEKHSLDVVQLPANIFDRRLMEGGHLERFLASGIEVQVRSVLLQGVLLGMPPPGRSVPQRVLDESALFRAKCKREGIDPLGAALAPVLGASPVIKIVVGVTGTDELEGIINALSGARALANYEPPAWSHEFDPRTWKN